jgi:hypothetical protein
MGNEMGKTTLVEKSEETVIVSVYLRTKDRKLVKRAIRLLPKKVFSTWKHPPRFKTKVHSGCSDNEFELSVSYKPVDENDMGHHEAMDLALAFILGYLAGSKQ